MKPSLLVLVASSIGASPPTRTNGRLPTNPRSIHVCGRPFVWVEGGASAPNAAHGWEPGPFAEVRLPQPGVEGELFFVVVFFLSR